MTNTTGPREGVKPDGEEIVIQMLRENRIGLLSGGMCIPLVTSILLILLPCLWLRRMKIRILAEEDEHQNIKEFHNI